MIRFANPTKLKMVSGNESLELTDAGSWESFPAFAKKYIKQIGAKLMQKTTGPDMHLWEIEYDGVMLNFVYDDFPNGISVEPKDNGGQSAIDKLFEQAKEQSEPNGL